jgi:hypothetical protein
MTPSMQQDLAGILRGRDDNKQVMDALKVLFVTIGSIAAVVFASLVISIIQFQSRLAEARTQNSSITFESIELIADYQGHISRLYTSMRARAEELGPLKADYLDRFNATTQQSYPFAMRSIIKDMTSATRA